MAEVWEAETRDVDDVTRFRLFAGGEAMPFRSLFELLETDSRFGSWYTALLAGSPYRAFFWEHPPLTRESMSRAAEFVLIESASLVNLRADASPFAPQFERQAGESEVIAFSNLGGDARLVVPRPTGSRACYAHLAAFLREGRSAQIRRLWQVTAGALREALGERPVWLSTSGLGVAWLHVRLDTRPKYYQYGPYKRMG